MKKQDKPNPEGNGAAKPTKKRSEKEKLRPEVISFQRELEARKKREEMLAMIEKVNSTIDESARTFRFSLYDAYKSKILTDVTVQLDDAVFSCHGLILATATTYFDKKIRLEHCAFIRLSHPSINGRTFRSLLEFFYLGRFVKDIGATISDIVKALSYLGITPKFERMFGLALSVMDEDLLLQHWSATVDGNLQEAADILFKVICKDFPKLRPDDVFLKLKCQKVIDLINNDELNAENEETVCDMALLWLSHNESNGDDALLVFQAMRLSQVSKSYLTNYVETFHLLEEYPACKTFVDEARYFHEQPGRRHDYYDKRYHFRLASNMTETMVMFGGIKKDGSPGQMILAFNFSTHTWCSIGTIAVFFGHNFAYCTYDNDIYVSGGSVNPFQVIRYVVSTGRWGKIRSLAVGRSRHCMEVVDTNIYVLGGVDVQDKLVTVVEELNTQTGVWRTVGKLLFPVQDACSAVLSDKIYTFGGLMDSRKNSATGLVQCFDPRDGQMTLIKDMAMYLNRPNAIKLNRSVYVIDSYGKVYEISEDHLTVSELCSLPDFNRKKFGLYTHHGKLLVMGGETGDIINDDMICFVPNSKKSIVCPWTDLMPPVRSDFGIAKIVVDKSKLKEELNVRAL